MDEEDRTEVKTVRISPCGRCCSWLRPTVRRAIDRVLAKSTQTEVCEYWRLAWPTIIFLVLQHSLPVITYLFCGHLGKVELAAVGIGGSFSNVTGLSVVGGLSSACDTLFSQAFGGNRKRLVGIILQRAILFTGLFVFPIIGLWLNAESMLLLIGIDANVARLAGVYLKIASFSLPAWGIYLILRKFLQNQSLVKVPVVVSLVVVTLSITLNSLAIFAFDMGLEASVIIQVFCQCLQPILLVALMKWKKLGLECWYGWSWEALYDWTSYAKLAFPGMFMMCIEWWSLEVYVFIAGTLSVLDSAAFNACIGLLTVRFMVSLGLSIAASIRVGNFLGANKPEAAKLSGKVATAFVATWAFLESLTLLVSRNQIGWIFSNDKKVIALVGKSMIVIVANTFFDDIQTVFGGIYRGSGRQILGLIVNIVSYYVIALPFSIPVALLTSMDTLGLWLGAAVASFVQVAVGVAVLPCSNWTQLAKKAVARVDGVQANIESALQLDTFSESVEVEAVETNEIESDLTQLLSDEDDLSVNNEDSKPEKVTANEKSDNSQKERPRNFRVKALRVVTYYVISLALLTSAGITSQYKPAVEHDLCSSNYSRNSSEKEQFNLTICVNSSSAGIMFATPSVPAAAITVNTTVGLYPQTSATGAVFDVRPTSVQPTSGTTRKTPRSS